MIRVPKLRRAARIEVDRAVIWYEEKRIGLGVEFLSEFRKTMQKIAERPTSFPIDYRKARRALLDRFPYKAYFLIGEDGTIEIVGVLHSSQKTSRLRGRFKSSE
ncbi:MAG TPA: hypothetical protein VLJ39_02090 [Tepidisphaeraceae bacterium]|nr:hypothetical protein [Tepidisphaeraceae bacterium]